MSAGSLGLTRLASTKAGVAIGAERLMSIGAVNGMVSGIAGGVANVEADSLVRTGKLDFDREHLGKSMYEMSLFGGVFGFGAGMVGRVSSLTGRESIESREPAKRPGAASSQRQPPDLTEATATNTPQRNRWDNDNFPAAANDNHRELDQATQWKMAVGQDFVPPPKQSALVNEPGASERFSVVSAGNGHAGLGGDEAADRVEATSMNSGNSGNSGLQAVFAVDEEPRFFIPPSLLEPVEQVVTDQAKALTELHSDAEKQVVLSETVGKDWTRESIIKAIQEGYDLSGADLRELDLRGVKFDGINLKWTNFRGCDLQGADFSKAITLQGADFGGADLSNAILRRSYSSGSEV